MNAGEALLVAGMLHLGFQVTVTGVVYPALSEVGDDDWARAHDAHSRRITRLVAPVYFLLAGACLWVLVAGPYDALLLAAVSGAALSGVTTMAVAAPTHGRLGRERTSSAVRRLLVADAVRLVGALVCAGCSLLWFLG